MIKNKYQLFIECESCKGKMLAKYFLLIKNNNHYIESNKICDACIRNKKIDNVIKN